MVLLELQRGALQGWGVHKALQGQDLLHNRYQGAPRCHIALHQGSSYPEELQVLVLQLLGSPARRDSWPWRL